MKLKQNGKLLSMYSAIIVIDLLYPLEVSWSEQFTISNDIIKALIITGATLPPIRHKHVSGR